MIENAEAKRAKAAAACRKWYGKNKAKEWRRQLLKNYKMTSETYDRILASQNNKCAICDVDQSEFTRALSVDHDHNCCESKPTCGNRNRGLLCRKCNQAIGLLGDNPDIAQKAALYLWYSEQDEVASCG